MSRGNVDQIRSSTGEHVGPQAQTIERSRGEGLQHDVRRRDEGEEREQEVDRDEGPVDEPDPRHRAERPARDEPGRGVASASGPRRTTEADRYGTCPR